MSKRKERTSPFGPCYPANRKKANILQTLEGPFKPKRIRNTLVKKSHASRRVAQHNTNSSVIWLENVGQYQFKIVRKSSLVSTKRLINGGSSSSSSLSSSDTPLPPCGFELEGNTEETLAFGQNTAHTHTFTHIDGLIFKTIVEIAFRETFFAQQSPWVYSMGCLLWLKFVDTKGFHSLIKSLYSMFPRQLPHTSEEMSASDAMIGTTQCHLM